MKCPTLKSGFHADGQNIESLRERGGQKRARKSAEIAKKEGTYKLLPGTIFKNRRLRMEVSITPGVSSGTKLTRPCGHTGIKAV
jgi:hypothetical protein